MDLPPAARGGDLRLGGGLRQEHRGFQVGLVNAVEGRFGDFPDRLLDLHADAIDERIETAEAATTYRLRGNLEISVTSSATAAASAPEACWIFFASASALAISRPRSRRARHASQAQKRGFTKAAIAAGNECHLSGKIEHPPKRLAGIELGRDRVFGHDVSVEMQAGVEVENLAGDETRQRRQEEAHAMCEFFRLAESPDRYLLEQGIALACVNCSSTIGVRI